MSINNYKLIYNNNKKIKSGKIGNNIEELILYYYNYKIKKNIIPNSVKKLIIINSNTTYKIKRDVLPKPYSDGLSPVRIVMTTPSTSTH